MDAPGSVLILTCAEDPTADAVVAELAGRDVPVVRLDLGDFPVQLRLSAVNTGGAWTGRFGAGRVAVDWSDVRSVYFRRPTRFRLPAGLSEPDQVLAAVEARHAIGGVLASLDTLWVNDPLKQVAAEYKPLQLAVAATSGLRVPETLLTNHQPDAVEFAARVGGRVVGKQLSSIVLSEQDEMRMTYTTLLDPAGIDPVQFGVTAHVIQKWIPKAYEARVVVVGREPISVAIRSSSAAGQVDWRSDYDSLSYERVDTPDPVRLGTGRFMDTLGLNFGAFDFVVTPDGEWVMLECNPAGQWLWLEQETGAPIAGALAELLAAGRSR